MYLPKMPLQLDDDDPISSLLIISSLFIPCMSRLSAHHANASKYNLRQAQTRKRVSSCRLASWTSISSSSNAAVVGVRVHKRADARRWVRAVACAAHHHLRLLHAVLRLLLVSAVHAHAS